MGSYTKLTEILRAADVFDALLADMYSPDEMNAIERFGLERFTAAEAAALWGISEQEAESRLESSYRKGQLNKFPDDAPPRYAMAEMYYYLDCFVMGDTERWGRYPQELVNAVDAWYFGEYCKRVDMRMNSEEKPSELVYPLDEALRYIEALPYDLYVLPCDCSTILRAYDAPMEVCIQSVDPVVNSIIDRGFGRKISKEEAKEIVRKADHDGLIHSPTSYHFCNCGPKYCYPFRCAELRSSQRAWPKAFFVAQVDTDKCVGCKLCVKRCPMEAITIQDKKAVVNEQVCVGCGVCRVPCKKDAISMKNVVPVTSGFNH